MIINIDELLNKTLVDIKQNKYEITFECDNGDKYKMYHVQECCEDVYLEDVCGDLNNLIGSPIVMAEESSNIGPSEYASSTWTFYKFATQKGYVTLRWLGISSGYYSEKVSIEKIN